jgi:ABC-type multidrug transport system ATPase subunit
VSNEVIVSVEGLSKKFGTFEAVKDVSFKVHRGDVFGFLGPNGAGKSTTIRCLLSLISPDQGKVSLFGKSFQTNRREILSNVGSIIEKPDFYRYLSAEKNLEIFARISGAEVSKKEIQEMLDFVGLGDRGKHKVKGFSHGMKQRLGIAQTLLHKPDLIILDEPTTGLDPQGIVEVRNLILRLKNEQNKTIILSSHQLAEIELISNRMVIIDQGRTIVEGSVEELLNAQELVVRFEVDRLEEARRLVSSAYSTAEVNVISDKEFDIALDQQQIPLLNKLFVENGINVTAIEPKRKLEDYFLKTIQS